MKEFFHVARRDISEAEQLDLVVNDWFIEDEILYKAEEFKMLKSSLYPNGISKHGMNYLHHVFKFDSNYIEFSSYFIEFVFELVRRLKFPEKHTRFTSVFGCLTLEDARKIQSQYFNDKGSIYKVCCEKYFIADMSFLEFKGGMIGMEIVAAKYWSGSSSENPFWEVLMDSPVRIIQKIE